MTASKSSKKRKGCWVCGQRFIRDHSLPTAQKNTCVGCWDGRRILDGVHRPDELYHLIVDGSFVTQSGRREVNEPGFGGAGLVLVDQSGEVIASQSCGFAALHSADAEFQAIVRGARWMPEVSIFTDSQSHASRARGELSRDVRFLPIKRLPGYVLAHELSVKGRLLFVEQLAVMQADGHDRQGAA
jgi:hypothetical protein